MILHSCEIAGFGRLHELNIDFKNGLNTVLEENGWGKTTFSVFLKAMFFGMEYSRKRTLSEREHYRPWDGGTFGGSLIFSVGDRTYRIERTFGRKDTEDTFELFDQSTGLKSGDYSSAIGEELFQVDRESFEKSVFIPQNNLQTAMTDSLNAKMGDLTMAQDDINHFDMAIKRLEEAKRSYTRNSKVNPGRLVAIRQKIRECREYIEELPAVADAFEKQQDVLEEKRHQLKELKASKLMLQKQIAIQSKRERELGAYRTKKQTYDSLEEEFEESRAFFHNGLPDRTVLDSMDELEKQLAICDKRMEALRLSMPPVEKRARLSELFEGNEISDEKRVQWENKADRILALRMKGEHTRLSDDEKEQLADLSVYFARNNPDMEELEGAMADAALLAQLQGQVDALEEQYRDARTKASVQQERVHEKGEPRGVLYWIVAIVVLLGGAGAFILFLGGTNGLLLAAICAVLAVFIGVMVVFDTRRRRREEEQRLSTLSQAAQEIHTMLTAKTKERNRQKDLCRDFLSGFLVSPSDSYLQMIGEIQRKKELFEQLLAQEEKILSENSETLEELSALQIELYTELTPYASAYGMDLYEEHLEKQLIQRIQEDSKAFFDYKSAREEYDELKLEMDETLEAIEDFLRLYPTREASVKQQLLEIRKKLDYFHTTDEQLSRLNAELREFEKNHNVDEDTRSVVALQQEESRTDAEIAELNSQLLKAEELSNSLSDQMELIEENSEKLDALIEQEETFKKKAQLYDSTIMYLTRAREAFLTRYMGPLRKGLWKYLGMIGADRTDIAPSVRDFTLDMDLRVRLTYHGSSKESEYLSSGYQDLVFVCARLALIDVLYHKEEPFLILDDPFTNLDEERTKCAMELLNKLAESRQVIYYTCHGSRIP